jgi:hypothetical protein
MSCVFQGRYGAKIITQPRTTEKTLGADRLCRGRWSPSLSLNTDEVVMARAKCEPDFVG